MKGNKRRIPRTKEVSASDYIEAKLDKSVSFILILCSVNNSIV